MARKNMPPSAPEPRQFTSVREVDDAVAKLTRRLHEVLALAPESTQYDDPRIDVARSNFVTAILEVFGGNSPEYIEHQYHRMSSGSISLYRNPPGRLQENYRRGHADTVAVLKGLIARLLEARSDLEGPHAQPKMEFRSRTFHPLIVSAAERLFDDGHHAQAVLEASKALVDAVKRKSGRQDLDGANLMRTVFSRSNPKLAFNALADQSDQDEQEGLMHLFEGAALALRNPRAHRAGMIDDPQYGLECLSLLSMLAGRLDVASIRP